MSDYRYCVGTFTRRVGSGYQTVPVSDAQGEFTPKAVIVWGTVQTTNGFTDTSRFSLAWTDATKMMNISNYTPDNGDTTATRAYMTNLFCPATNTAAQTTISDGAGSYVFSLGNFRMFWGATPGELVNWHFLAMGGLDLNVVAGTLVTPTSIGSQIVSVPGIGQITGVLFTHPLAVNFDISTGVSGVGNANLPSTGWAAANGQAAITTHVDEFTTSAPTYRSQRTDLALHMLAGGTFTSDRTRASVTSLGVNAFTLNWTHVNNPDGLYEHPGAYFLAISGPKVSTGVISGTTIPLDFQPGAVLAQTVGGPPTSSLQTELRYSFGAYDGISHGNSWIGVKSGVATSVTARRMATDRLLTTAIPVATGSNTVPEIEASATFGTEQVILDYHSTDPTGVELLYFAMEGTPLVPDPIPPANISGNEWALHRFDMKVRMEERA